MAVLGSLHLGRHSNLFSSGATETKVCFIKVPALSDLKAAYLLMKAAIFGTLGAFDEVSPYLN